MNREELKNEIQVIAREIFAKPELVITDTTSATDVDTWTSLSFMQFLTKIENQFGFKFKMMEILKLQNMGAVINAIENHTNA